MDLRNLKLITFTWLSNDVHLSDKVIERKERLIQTYIILFGLLISYGQDASLQGQLMNHFIGFLLSSILYYINLPKVDSVIQKIVSNSLALFVAYDFAIAVNLCSIELKPYHTFLSLTIPSWLDSFSGVLYLLLVQIPEYWYIFLIITVFFSLKV